MTRMQPLQEIALGIGAELEEIHHLRHHFPGGMATQRRAMHPKEFHRVQMKSIALVEQRAERISIGDDVLHRVVH